MTYAHLIVIAGVLMICVIVVALIRAMYGRKEPKDD